MSEPEGADLFAHLKRQAAERSDRTVERIGAGIAALRAGGQKITAESLKQATRELEPGFAGLSFQVIRRNALASSDRWDEARLLIMRGVRPIVDLRPSR